MLQKRAGRRSQPMGTEVAWIAVGVILSLLVGVLLLWWGASVASGQVRDTVTDRDLITILVGQFSGDVPVPGLTLVLFGLGLIVLLVLLAGVVLAVVRSQGGQTRVDGLAKSMARPKDLQRLSLQAVEKDSEKLGALSAGPGVPLGRLVNNKSVLRASWEWVQIWIMGPRAGKTSCVCVPQILETKGPVVATSNKRDIVDLTRGPRSENGVVWVHDVQDIIGEEPSWWWNPLTFVEDMETAEKLADIFITSATSAGQKQDSYFESDGKRLLSYLLLAASVAERPITDVFAWGNDEDDKTPANCLFYAGLSEHSHALAKIQDLTPRQRDGVYGTMRPWISVLGNEKVIPWIRDTGVIGRSEFDHQQFHAGTDTLYLISREGGGSARAITGALAMAVLTAAEKRAGRQKGGRLSPPLMAVLDEAANVVRWRELPDLYSHYGSRGIVVSTFFQSFTQGVEAFGKEGMKKLWSSANVRVAGAGLSEDEFLPFVSNLVGERDVVKRTSSQQRGGQQLSTSIQREKILDQADVAALPTGRAILSSSGQPAALMALEHHSQKPYATKVQQSQQFYESQLDGPS